VNYDNSLVVTITVTCYSRAPSNGDHLFTCGAIYRPLHRWLISFRSSEKSWKIMSQQTQLNCFDNYGRGVRLVVSIIMMSLKEVTRRHWLVLHLN